MFTPSLSMAPAYRQNARRPAISTQRWENEASGEGRQVRKAQCPPGGELVFAPDLILSQAGLVSCQEQNRPTAGGKLSDCYHSRTCGLIRAVSNIRPLIKYWLPVL